VRKNIAEILYNSRSFSATAELYIHGVSKTAHFVFCHYFDIR